MNDFKENLKYNPNDLSQTTKDNLSNSIFNKVKKAAMIGSLSLMAAISTVGCSKKENLNNDDIMPILTTDTTSQNKLSKNQEAQQELIKETQSLLETLQNSTNFELSDNELLKLTNLLLKNVFVETSNNYNGDIPYNSIIPNISNSSLSGTFRINDDQKSSIKNYDYYEKKGLILDKEATELYNDYYSTSDILPITSAIKSLYKLEISLCRDNKELLQYLSEDEIKNLMKSSYVAAYNNKLATNPENSSNNKICASDFIVYIDKPSENQYTLSSYVIDSEGNHSLFETTLDSNNVQVIDDYLEPYSIFYEDSSNIEEILNSLASANEENQVSEDQLVQELTDIAERPQKMEAYLTKTGLKWAAKNVSNER